MAVLTPDECATNRAPGRLFRRLDKILSAFVESRFSAFDISFRQWVALKVVRDGKASTAGELAREIGLSTGATTRLIDALERRRLMARARGSGDRRVVGVAVTAAGLDAIATLQRHVVEAWNEVLAEFDQGEFERTVDFLVRLLAAAERVAGDLNLPEEQIHEP